MFEDDDYYDYDDEGYDDEDYEDFHIEKRSYSELLFENTILSKENLRLRVELKDLQKRYSELLDQSLLEAQRSCAKTLELVLSGAFSNPSGIVKNIYDKEI